MPTRHCTYGLSTSFGTAGKESNNTYYCCPHYWRVSGCHCNRVKQRSNGWNCAVTGRHHGNEQLLQFDRACLTACLFCWQCLLAEAAHVQVQQLSVSRLGWILATVSHFRSEFSRKQNQVSWNRNDVYMHKQQNRIFQKPDHNWDTKVHVKTDSDAWWVWAGYSSKNGEKGLTLKKKSQWDSALRQSSLLLLKRFHEKLPL